MLKTLRLSFSLKNTYKVNGVLYSLKQVPFLKKLLPDDIYGVKAFKIFAHAVSVLLEIWSVALSKALYVLTMIFLPLFLYTEGVRGSAFIFIFIMLSVVGAVANTFMFEPSKDKYYAMSLMRMNAREYTLINYFYYLLKVLTGLTISSVIFGSLAGAPLYLCVLTPLFVVSIKMTVACFCLHRYKKTGAIKNDMKLGKALWSVMLILPALAYALPVFKIILPDALYLTFMLLGIMAGAYSFVKILCFKQYTEIYKRLLTEYVSPQALTAQLTRAQNDKIISMDETAFSQRKGFEYLNELFIKRHRKILWSSAKKTSLICALAILCIFAAAVLVPSLRPNINSTILNYLPYLLFLMYAINRGTGFTGALFANCDHSLLTYSFYKQPKQLLRLFQIRLREIIKINILPAAIIGAGLSALLLISGGTPYALDYLLLPLAVISMSIFFSVHYLMLYYLLQPYNAGTEMKSATYTIALSATYFVCLFGMRLNVSTLAFSLLIIAFCLIYCAVACVAVYKIAPKTFKLRM